MFHHAVQPEEICDYTPELPPIGRAVIMGAGKRNESGVAGNPCQFLAMGERNNVVVTTVHNEDRPCKGLKRRPVVV